MKHETHNMKHRIRSMRLIRIFSGMFQVSSFKFQEKGFTLIEMIVYIAIVSIIGGVLISFLANSFKSYNKAQAMQQVFNNTDGSLRTITNEIKYARSLYTPTSVFDNDNGQLSLETALNAPADENTAFVDFYLDNGRIYEKREGSSTEPLTSEKVFVSALRFTSVAVSGKNSVSVKITSRINTASTQPGDQAQLTLNSTASLRGSY